MIIIPLTTYEDRQKLLQRIITLSIKCTIGVMFRTYSDPISIYITEGDVNLYHIISKNRHVAWGIRNARRQGYTTCTFRKIMALSDDQLINLFARGPSDD